MTDAGPTLWLLVGLPAVGKTTRAQQLEAELGALRLTPDDWLLATLGTVTVSDDVRYRTEGQLLDTAVPALLGGVDVVVDFGLWGRDERTALRWLAAQLGARAAVELLDVDETEQLRRIRQRTDGDPRLAIPVEQVRSWRTLLQLPTRDELDGGPLDPPPAGAASWGAWAAGWWPGLRLIVEEQRPDER